MILRIRYLLSFLFEKAVWRFPVNQIAGVLFDSHEFHQAMFPVFFIQAEGLPNQYRSSDYAEADTHPLVNANHIHNDKNHEDGKQASGEYEKVLGFQAFELHTFAYSFVDIKLHNFYRYEVD
jgi:hypothetical protein